MEFLQESNTLQMCFPSSEKFIVENDLVTWQGERKRKLTIPFFFYKNLVIDDHLFFVCLNRLIGMPKEKYDPPDPRRIYTIMSAEEVANGKKSHWAELEISGEWNLEAFNLGYNSNNEHELNIVIFISLLYILKYVN